MSVSVRLNKTPAALRQGIINKRWIKMINNFLLILHLPKKINPKFEYQKIITTKFTPLEIKEIQIGYVKYKARNIEILYRFYYCF